MLSSAVGTVGRDRSGQDGHRGEELWLAWFTRKALLTCGWPVWRTHTRQCQDGGCVGLQGWDVRFVDWA